MKEIIYLEPDEEITSIVDKLKKLKDAELILLVAPKDASIIQSVVNLKIIKKQAKDLKINLAFVTKDQIGRNLAAQVGIPVYESINSDAPIAGFSEEQINPNEIIEIDMSESNKKSKKPPKNVHVNYYQTDKQDLDNNKDQSSSINTEATTSLSMDKYEEPNSIADKKKDTKRKKIILGVSIGVIAILTLLYFVVPQADVQAVIKTESISEKIDVFIDTSKDKISEDNKTIPGVAFGADKEISREFNATGKKDVGEKSKGTVIVSNGSGTIAELPSGSKLENSDGLVFVTSGSISVPAATASVDASGNVIKNSGTATVSVEAQEPGERYNIGSSNFTIYNQSMLTASNQSSFTGGVTRQVTVVSQEDINKAYEQLENDAKLDVKNNLTNQAKDKKLTLLSNTIEYKRLNNSTNKQVNEETDKFSANLKVNGKTIGFSEEDYRKSVIAVLGEKVPDGKELVLSSDDEIAQGDIDLDFSKGTMQINGTIKTKLAPKVDLSGLSKSLKGKSIISANNLLRENSNISSSQITLKPNLFGTLPRLSGNIHVIISYQWQDIYHSILA